MRWRFLPVFALCFACDKEAIYENTKPPEGSSSAPRPSLDGGLGIDAGLSSSDAGVVEGPLTFTKPGLLRAIGDCTLGRLRSFAALTRELEGRTRAYAETLADDRRDAARAAWAATMVGWQELELFRFGPAGSSAEPGGLDLRNQIYFFPDINNCQVDLQLAARGYEARPLAIGVGEKGLSALEYLLFYTGPDNSCTSASIAPASWAALQPELPRRRADYALALSEDLVAKAAALLAAWETGQGDYYTKFVQAGAGSSLFARDQDAFNVVDNALYYFDKELKDQKVGLPLGLNPECMKASCPERVESRFALFSNTDIVANVVGFRLLFQGCGAGYTGLGFDDWLRSANKAELADRMNLAAANAEQVARALPGSLEPLLSTNPAQVLALYEALKAVSDLLKAELPGALNLEPPMSVAGDND